MHLLYFQLKEFYEGGGASACISIMFPSLKSVCAAGQLSFSSSLLYPDRNKFSILLAFFLFCCILCLIRYFLGLLSPYRPLWPLSPTTSAPQPPGTLNLSDIHPLASDRAPKIWECTWFLLSSSMEQLFPRCCPVFWLQKKSHCGSVHPPWPKVEAGIYIYILSPDVLISVAYVNRVTNCSKWGSIRRLAGAVSLGTPSHQHSAESQLEWWNRCCGESITNHLAPMKANL